MNSVSPINLKKARRYLRRSYMEGEDDDASIISDDLPILKENEISFPYKDRNFAYVFGIKNFVDVLKSKGKVSISKPSESKSKDVEQLITIEIGNHTVTLEQMKKRFLYAKDEEGDRTIFVSHPIRRSVKIVNNENDEKFKEDFISVFRNYENQLCVHCLLKRVDELLQNEWNKIHGEKRPSEVYTGRTDREFPREYQRIEYAKADRKAMQVEWKKLHANKKPEYIV